MIEELYRSFAVCDLSEIKDGVFQFLVYEGYTPQEDEVNNWIIFKHKGQGFTTIEIAEMPSFGFSVVLRQRMDLSSLSLLRYSLKHNINEVNRVCTLVKSYHDKNDQGIVSVQANLIVRNMFDFEGVFQLLMEAMKRAWDIIK